MSETQNIERPGQGAADVAYRVSPPLSNDELNALSAAAWREHVWRDFGPVLNRSLAFVCAYHESLLVGFVNLAWDGGEHAFILDTLVRPEFRRRGIGRELVRRAVAEAEARGVKWVHVDFEPHLQSFYDGCGFRATAAGLILLRAND
ncbi:MAG TPA: GNAT family N-acetyltransferase [Pyrinomonadaceae bacterium]|nr:GNAT family N-acetyltransferase [Pyrinomonadaceae bacterium]